ncbi:MAG: hypothetical protein WAK16_11655 [Candidatus Cybelea sp.]
MLTRILIALTASLVIATPGLASATLVTSPARLMQPAPTFVQPDRHKKPAIKAGIVNSDGSIGAGTGYSVSHDGTGEYTLDVPGGFKNCPAVLVTPSGINGHAPIANDYNYTACGGGGEVKIQIRVYSRTSGALQDNSFHFVMIDT